MSGVVRGKQKNVGNAKQCLVRKTPVKRSLSQNSTSTEKMRRIKCSHCPTIRELIKNFLEILLNLSIHSIPNNRLSSLEQRLKILSIIHVRSKISKKKTRRKFSSFIFYLFFSSNIPTAK